MAASGNIVKDGQGVYRWVHEFNLWTNPTLLFTVLKVFVIALAVLVAFMFLLLIPDLIGAAGMHSPCENATCGKGTIMRKLLAILAAAMLCACCLGLASCGGSGSGGAASGSAGAGSSSSSVASASAGSPSSSASASNASASEKHDSYFVGKWDLYESDEYTHEQVVQVREQYANDAETRKKMNEAYGRDNVEFCARFAADGTGEIDTGSELVSFTWEATNEGAVTFTSFNGKSTAMHLPVTDGKFTLNGDTYAKAS